MKQLLLNFFSLLLCTAFAHPLKMSNTDVHMIGKVMKFQIKIFQDDFKTVLDEKFQKNHDFNQLNGETEKNIKKYILEHIQIKVNGANVKLEFLNAKPQDLVLVIVVSASCKLLPTNTIEIKNTLLFEKFKDQINIVRMDLVGDGNYTSMRFGYDFDHGNWEVPFK